MNARLLLFIAALVIAISPAQARKHHYKHHHSPQVVLAYGQASDGETVIGGRPAGCPHAFCGCEASRYVFGRIIADLNLASNWIRKFPRTSPAPGMAAARNHHVMILISQVSSNVWHVHDGNSGRHLTREHDRSITGYVIVNPHGGRLALR